MAAVVLLVLSVCASGAALAANCTSITTGNWNAQTTWGKAGAGCVGAPGGIPGTGDNVTIGNVAHTVTITDNRTANALQFATGNQVSGLTINGGVTLTVNGSMTVTGQNGGSGVRLVDVLADGQLVVGNDLILVGGSNNNRDVGLRLGDSAATAVTVTNDLAGTAAGGNFSSANRVHITFLGQGTINVGRNLGGNSNLTSGDGIFVLNGAGAQSIGSYNTATRNFNHLTIAKAGGTATFAGNVRIRGDLTDNGNFDPASGNRTIILAGTALQNLAGSAASTTFYRVTLNNSNGFNLGHDLNITNRLTLTIGHVATNANRVHIQNGSSISSAGGSDFVVGNLAKSYAAGNNVTRVFEVGSLAGGAKYAPVSLRLGQVTGAGDFVVSTTAGDHPQMAASTLDPAQSVNRYWTFANDSVTFNAVANNRAIFTFDNPDDLDAGVTTGAFFASRYNAPNWTEITPSARGATTTTLSGAGITTANISGDYQLAERALVPPPIGGFNTYDTATAGGSISGFIRTKVAGTTISVDMIALNIARTAIETGFFGTLRVEVLDASDNTGALDPATGCRGSWTVIQTLSPDPVFVAGDNGRKTISFTQADAYRDARLRISYPAASPTSIGCSNDNFAIRPAGFANFSVSDDDWDGPGTTRALANVSVPGGVTHKAGQPFSVRATAVNAAGSPAVTTNYDGLPEAVLSTCAGSACPAGIGTFSVDTGFTAGQLVADAATYDEVGSLRVRLLDDEFAAVDAADGSTPAERNIESPQIDVGRFVPDRFEVSLNMPVFETACGSGYTYVGERFHYILEPVITVTAVEAGGNATENYEGTLWRITNASLSGKTYAAAAGVLDASGVPPVDPVIDSSPGSGTGTLTFDSGDGLFFVRTTPVTPFDADIGLSINLIDADGVTHASNPARFGQATAGNGIAFNDGKQMRFGRLSLANASGSQALPLPMQMETQYWNGGAFITNTLDNCTVIAASNVAMSGYTQNLAACDSSVTAGAFNSGRGLLQLSAPGAANTGGVELSVNLDAVGSGSTCIAGASTPVTGADLPYLQGNWGGGGFNEDPSAQATFGVYGGPNEVIHIQENFQ